MAEKQNYVLGRGRLYFDDGKGERYIGNTPSLALSVSTESVEHYSSEEGLRNRDRNIITQINYTGSFTTDHISPENLAMLFMGDKETITQSSLSGETDTFEEVVPGRFYQLGTDDANPAGKRKVSNVTATLDPGGSGTSLEEGTDYEVSKELGRIEILEGGSVSEGDTVEITYDVDEATVEQVVSGSRQVQGALRFISANPDGAGEQRDFFMPSVSVSADGDFTLKSDQDWQQIPFSLDITQPDGGEAVYANGRPFTAS